MGWLLLLTFLWIVLLFFAGATEIADQTFSPSSAGTLSPTSTRKIALPFITPDDGLNILSVAVSFKSVTPDVIFHYTADGTTPTENSSVASAPEDSSVGSETAPVVINRLGTVVVKCYASKVGMLKSDVATRVYKIIGHSLPPIISPAEGTYERSVNVTFRSSSPTGKVCYNIDSNADASRNATCVNSDSSLRIDTPGTHVVKAVTVDENMADSVESKATFHVLGQVAVPVVSPEASVFPIVAMLTVRCSTSEATIYYTLDGSEPSETSFTVPNGESIVVDTIGPHVLKVYALAPSMLASRVVRKEFAIQRRMGEPQLLPRPGTYTGDTTVVFECPAADGDVEGEAVNGRVYYTTDGVRTPSEQHSDSVPCGGSIALLSPGTTVLRAIAVRANRVASGVVQGAYTLVRPAYEEHAVNPAGLAFSVQPDVAIVAVEKSIHENSLDGVAASCSSIVRGRLVVLRNPVGHFDIVPPPRGCSQGALELPSVSGRQFQPPQGFNLTKYIGQKVERKRSSPSFSRRNLRKQVIVAADEEEQQQQQPELGEGGSPSELRLPFDASAPLGELPPYLQRLIEDEHGSVRASKLRELGERYAQVRGLGCQVASNAGFFDATSHTCLGNLVSAGTVHQLSDLHNVNFGLRNGSFVVGYVEKEEILDPRRAAFDFLVSGLGWLVRSGRSYVEESFSASGDAERIETPAAGDHFITERTARTALGHDKYGNLLILQVGGEARTHGMTLYEFADFAVELGFISAINLDGGDSAALTQNHSLISEPSWKCTESPYNSSAYFRCEKPVSSITCIHAQAPPFVAASILDRFVHARSPAPTAWPTPAPTPAPSEAATAPAGDDDRSQTASAPVNATSTESQLLAMQSSAKFYRVSAFTLLVVLIFSLCAHFATFVYFCDMSSIVKRGDSFGAPASDSIPDKSTAHEVQMVSVPMASSSPPVTAAAAVAAPSQGISSQYAAIPANKSAPPTSIMSYLPSLTGASRKRLGETPPEPSVRGPSGSPRSPTHKNAGAAEDELQDIKDWRPPSNLLMSHAVTRASVGFFGRSAAAAAATAEEEDFYRDEEDEEDGDGADCTDSSRLLQAPSRSRLALDPRGTASKHHPNTGNRHGDSGSSDESGHGRGEAVQKRVGLKAPKSSALSKAKSGKR